MKKSFLYYLCLVCIFTINSQAADVKGTVALEGETFNFELSGQKNWDYDLKRIKDKSQSKVQLFVKSIDKSFVDKIRNIENPFVKSISVTQNAIDNKWLIEFTLKNDQVETFDYLTDQPAKLIIDFYKSEAPVADLVDTKTSSSAISSKVVESKTNIAQNTKKKSGDRKPADIDVLSIKEPGGIETSVLSKAGLYDAGDSQFSRFMMRESDFKEESVIKSRGNYYLKFPVLESEFSFWKKMKENPPLYEIQNEKNEENKQARLLKTLFTKKRYLVFIQTTEWFKKKYVNSKYSELLSYMLGDAFIELWKAEKIDSLYEQAQNAYREALEKYPQSALAERTSLLMGMLAVEKADYMSAIRRLQAHVDNAKHEKKISREYAKIGLAYCYSKINKLDDALKFLNEIEKNTQDQLVLTEVAVRKGDFLFFTKKLNESIAAYDAASKNFPLVSKLFPSAYFNKMEAQFWKEKFQDSHKSGLQFAQNFPSHDFAPYALTRVGELLDIMGADQSKSVGAYLETHFRYGDSPKTIVARLHLLSTRMKSMKPEELDQTLVKMEELALKSDLPNVDQFKVTMTSDGFARRKEYLKAIDILSKFYQQNPTRSDAKQVTGRIILNINDQLKYLADKAQFKNLLKTYRQYSDTWLKSNGRLDTDYFLGLSYENAGAYSDAITKYKKVLAGITAIKGTSLEKEIYVNQYLPSFDSLYLKLAQSSFDNISFQDAYQYLEKIQNPLILSDEEQVQRVQLASKLYEQKGDTLTSIRYLSELSNVWKGEEKLSLPVQFRLAEMQTQQNDIGDALATYEKCREIILNNPKPTQADVVKLANAYSQLLINQSKQDEAISLLNDIFQRHGNKFNFNQERYLLGDLYFKKGQIKKAEQAWSNFKDEGTEMWKQLSTEKLKQAAWDVDYKKHLKRIPAMSQLEEQQQ
jgi:tetratricopeptide (TPR) repeat protein